MFGAIFPFLGGTTREHYEHYHFQSKRRTHAYLFSIGPHSTLIQRGRGHIHFPMGPHPSLAQKVVMCLKCHPPPPLPPPRSPMHNIHSNLVCITSCATHVTHTLELTRNVLLSAQMGERASVVLICIITSRYNEVK